MAVDLPDWTRRFLPTPVEPVAIVSADVPDNGSVSGALVAGVVGSRIEVVQLGLVAGGDVGTLAITSQKHLRGVIRGQWYTDVGGPVVVRLRAAISPEAPDSFPPIPGGAILLDDGVALKYSLLAGAPGLGVQEVNVLAFYRLV